MRYRRGARSTAAHRRRGDRAASKSAWTVIPLLLFLGIFAWAARDYVGLYRAAGRRAADLRRRQAVDVEAAAPQRPARDQRAARAARPAGAAGMTSQDVIHSFYVPAFRLKQDVVPGRYTRIWFTRDRGSASSACSAPNSAARDHAAMLGRVVVMQPAEYARWLGRRPGASPAWRSTASRCSGSSAAAAATTPRRPCTRRCSHGLLRPPGAPAGRPQRDRRRDLPARFDPAAAQGRGRRLRAVMPSFAGQFGEEELQRLIAYLAFDRRRMTAPDRRPQRAIELPRRRATRCARGSRRTTTSASRSSTPSRSPSFFFVGGAAATLIRLELATPAGDLVRADTYNKLFTAHGVIMVWLFLIPSIPSVLGNFLLPLMIGARDLAFPAAEPAELVPLHRRRRWSRCWRCSPAASTPAGPSTRRISTMFSNAHVVLTLVGVFVTGFSSILTGLNFIVTMHTLRAPGMTWFRLPLFVWAIYATSIILVLATPVLAMTTLLVVAERLFQVGVFDPALGGDPLLFQHLFWFYSHPAVYIMVLPAMGVVSEIIPCFARKRIFGYRFMAYAILGIAGVGFLVWGHHMFVSGQSVAASLVFSLLSFTGRGAVRDQGLQLDRDALQGLDPLRRADALCAGLRRPVHDRRADRAVPRLAGARRAPDRHLLRRRALPLHHGRRLGDGVLRRAAFLVAQGHRAAVPRVVGAHRGGADLLRLQPDLLPAVPAGLPAACRGATTATRPSSRCSTCCRRPARRSSRVGYLLPLVYLAGRCCARRAGGCQSVAARPGSSGEPPRRRRRTTSTSRPMRAARALRLHAGASRRRSAQ